MSNDANIHANPVSPWHRRVLLAATVLTFLLVTMGGIVCATDSSAACPDWPGCFGQVVPPSQINAIIEYLHRFIAALTTPFILTAAVLGWRNAHASHWVRRPPVMAIPFVLAVVVFGAFAVLTGLPPGVAAVDLGSALIVLALMTTATTAAFARPAASEAGGTGTGRAFARLSLSAMIAAFFVPVSGILVAGKGSPTRCLSWPMWKVMAGDIQGWPQIARLALAAVAGALIVAAVVQAWRTQREHAALVRLATSVGLVFAAEMAVGGLLLAGGQPIGVRLVYIALAAGLWVLLVALTTSAELDRMPELRAGLPATGQAQRPTRTPLAG